MDDYIRAIYNANVYIDGDNLLGKAGEFKLPDLEYSQDEYKGLGMVGTIKLPSGVEALEGEITWNSLYPEAALRTYHPFRASQLMVRGTQQLHDEMGLVKEVPVVTTITATSSKNETARIRRGPRRSKSLPEKSLAAPVPMAKKIKNVPPEA